MKQVKSLKYYICIQAKNYMNKGVHDVTYGPNKRSFKP